MMFVVMYFIVPIVMPLIMYKAICKKVKEVAEPIIAETAMQCKIKSIQFQTFTLGSLPPTFHG